MPLSEQRRAQLDQIVVKMANQNAPQEDVQSIVNDFKSKFDNEGIDQMGLSDPVGPMITQPKQGLLKRAASAVGNVGIGVGKGVLSTATGLSSLGEKAFDTVVNPAVRLFGGDTNNLSESSAQNVVPKQWRTPEGAAQNVGFAAEQLGEFFLPGGVASKVGKAAEGASLLAKAPSVVQKGVGLLARSGTEALTSGGQTLAQGGSGSDALKNATFSAALPFAGAAKNKIVEPLKKYVGESIAPRVINRVIKPKITEFEFGRNPGQAVVQEGIVANTKESLLNKISAKKQEVGQEIDRLLTSTENSLLHKNKKIDLNPLLKPIDDAMQTAVENGEQSLYTQLQGIKDGLTREFTVQEGRLIAGAPKNLVVTPKEAALIKRKIGDATRWTGQAYDKDTNQIRAKVYRNINDAIDKVIPGMKKINSRYANLLGAEKSLEKTISTAERQRLLGLTDVGLGAAVGIGSGDGLSPEGVTKGILAAAASRAARSPAIQTRLAQGLYKASTKEPSKILPKLGKTAKNLYLSQSFDRE